MHFLNRLRHLLSVQVLVLISTLYTVRCCNFGPGNLGLFNFGVGNVGFLNFGAGNTGLGNKGFLNGGLLNTGFSQLGIRNIGAFNIIPIPNTISVANVPLAPNFTPPIPLGRRRRRRSTMNYPADKFPWMSATNNEAKISRKKLESSNQK